MTQDDERRRFSDRFKQSLVSAGIDPIPARVAELVNLRAPIAAVSPSAARKWLKGLAIPSQNRLQILADILDVDAAWLRFGDVEPGNQFGTPPISLVLDAAEHLLVSDYRLMGAESQALVRSLLTLLLRFEQESNSYERHLGSPINYSCKCPMSYA